MSLQQKIKDNLKESMKNREADTVSVLRMLTADLLNYSVAQGKRGEELTDEEVIPIVSRQIKQRKDSIDAYEKGDRPELAQKEKAELEILQVFMPEQMSEEEIKKVIQEIINGGASNFGQVMGAAMGKLKGKADGAVVRKIIEESLAKK